MTDFHDEPLADLGAAEDLAGPNPDERPPGPPDPAAPYRRLYRSRDDRKLGGVSAGIAEYLGLDPTIVRFAVLLLAFTGVGILVYIAAWIIVPERPNGVASGPAPSFSTNERGVQIAFGVGAIALAIGIVSGSWALLAFALIGGGVWLLSQQNQPSQPHPQPGDTTVPAPGMQTNFAPPPPASTHSTPPPPEWQAAAPPTPREPQIITRVVLSLLALLVGLGIAAASGGWWDVSATRLVGVGVIITGVGVVAGVIRKGGAQGLIPIGILAALALIPLSALDGLIDEGVGDTVYRPTSLAELEDEYQLGIGELTVDLSEIDLDGETHTVDVDLGIGHALLILPSDAGGTATLDAHAGEIEIDVPGRSRRTDNLDGVNVESGTITLAGEGGELIIDVHVGFGLAELRQGRG